MSPELEQQIAADIAEARAALARGSTTEAIEKLWRIAANVPPGTALSKEIGDLYFELGFSAMAGRYWYLLDDKSDEMTAACKEFEDSVGGSPTFIFHAFAPWSVAMSPSVRESLRELQQSYREFHRANQYRTTTAKGSVRDRVALLGCALVAFVVMFVFVAGVVFISMSFR